MANRRWAVILGSSAGFGAATARAFADEGYGIFGVHMDRRTTMPIVDALVEEIKGKDVPCVFFNGNAAGDESRAKALDQLREAMQPGDTVQVLMHSLAFGTLRPYLGDKTIGRKHMEMTLDVMAHSLVYWTQDLLDADLMTSGSRIYAMTSAGSLVMWPSYGAVSAAKCALESHCRQLALELAPKGITVNAIMAGVTRTAALEKIPGAKEMAAGAEARNPSGRLTQPKDVADCLVGLSGPRFAWMTGNVLRLDGGESITG